MKALLLIMLLAPFPLQAADLVLTIPTASVANTVAQCDSLREGLRVRLADWSNEICATMIFRVGLRELTRTASVAQQVAAVHAVENAANGITDAAMVEFDADFPPPASAVICGDGILDTEFGEECDDGNDIGADGCTECVVD